MKKVKKPKIHHLSTSYQNVLILDDLRKRYGLTVTEIALILAISRPHYHRILKSLASGDGVLKLAIDRKVQIALTVLSESRDHIIRNVQEATDKKRIRGVMRLSLDVAKFKAASMYANIPELDFDMCLYAAESNGVKRRVTSKS